MATGRREQQSRAWWTDEETAQLLIAVGKPSSLRCLDGKSHRNAAAFQKVAEEMQRMGCNKTWQQIRMRWKALKALYRKTKQANSVSVMGRLAQFYDQLDGILGSMDANNGMEITRDANEKDPLAMDSLDFDAGREDGSMGETKDVTYYNVFMEDTNSPAQQLLPDIVFKDGGSPVQQHAPEVVSEADSSPAQQILPDIAFKDVSSSDQNLPPEDVADDDNSPAQQLAPEVVLKVENSPDEGLTSPEPSTSAEVTNASVTPCVGLNSTKPVPCKRRTAASKQELALQKYSQQNMATMRELQKAHWKRMTELREEDRKWEEKMMNVFMERSDRQQREIIQSVTAAMQPFMATLAAVVNRTNSHPPSHSQGPDKNGMSHLSWIA